MPTIKQQALRLDSNPLGLVNPLKPHGLALLAFAGILAVPAVIAAAGRDPAWLPVGCAGAFALFLVVRGLTLHLQPLYVPTTAPGPLRPPQGGGIRDILTALFAKDATYLGIYQLPTGLASMKMRSSWTLSPSKRKMSAQGRRMELPSLRQ